jgi:hypothetical protein
MYCDAHIVGASCVILTEARSASYRLGFSRTAKRTLRFAAERRAGSAPDEVDRLAPEAGAAQVETQWGRKVQLADQGCPGLRHFRGDIPYPPVKAGVGNATGLGQVRRRNA